MDPRDPDVVRRHADRMAWALLGEQPVAATLVSSAASWFSAQPESVRMEPLPWLASHLAEAAVAAPPEVLDQAPDEEVGRFGRRELIEHLRRASPAGRAALLLHDGCGYSTDAVAALCRRPVDEVARLIEVQPLPSASAGPPPGAPTVEPAPPVEPASPPSEAPAPIDAPQQPEPAAAQPRPEPNTFGTAPSEAREERDGRGRGRRNWWRRSTAVGPLLALAVVAGLTAVVTHDGGLRPTLAEGAPAADRMDERAGCDAAPKLPVGSASMVDMQQRSGPRTSRVLVPPDADDRSPLPTLILLGDTGATADATAAATGIETLASAAGVVVVTPEPASDARAWNITETVDRPDDVQFVSAMLDELSTMLCLDPDRVSAVGLGTGAHMAGVLACRRNDRLAATVMVAGTYLPPTCSMPEPSPLFVLASAGDRVLPPEGGFGPLAASKPEGVDRDYRPASVDEALGRWAQLAGCSPHPQAEVDPSGVSRTTYIDCSEQVTVSGTVANLGAHGWPAQASSQVLSFVLDQVR